MGSNYRTLLLRISENITEKNLEKLKFLCSDDIKEGELEEIVSPLKLFKALERRDLIGVDNLSFLRELLANVKCVKMATEVDDFISQRELELLILGLRKECLENKPECFGCLGVNGVPNWGNHTFVAFVAKEAHDWQDIYDPSMKFWSSIKGDLKEKSWTNFEDAINRKFSHDVKRGGLRFMKFLAYVLRVNHDQKTSQNVSLHNFIRMTRWFGPFIKGSQDSCLRKMIDLMEHSFATGSDCKRSSWFAGYITKDEAKERLSNEKAGTFLVSFNASMVAPGFVLSKKSCRTDAVAEFKILVHRNTGHVEFADRIFYSLPSLVTELRL